MTFIRGGSLFLLGAYAALALAGAVSGVDALRVAALCALLALAGLSLVGRAGWRGWLAWITATVLALGVAGAGEAGLLLGLVPVAFCVAFGLLFAGTLRRGREPLVARIIRVIEGPERLELRGVRTYARHVTVFWAGLLLIQAAALLVLWLVITPGGLLPALDVAPALRLPAHAVAWYAHLGAYLVPLAAMLGEYAVRRVRLRHMPHPGLHVFGRRLVACWPQLLRDTVRS